MRSISQLAVAIGAAGLVAVLAVAHAGAQGKLDLAKPEDALMASRRVQCSQRDGQPVTFWWRGGVFSRVPGEQDRLIFNVEGMNIRACVTVTDAARGTGWRMVSRELLIYLDPKTNEVLRTWTNPWTGQQNDVIHVANDPVNQAPTYARSARGDAYRWTGRNVQGRVWQSIEVPLFYTNALGGEYQDYVGGQYQATEMFDFFMEEADLVDSSRDMRTVTIAWGRMSQWLPWMNMGDRSGFLMFTTVGKRLNDPANLSPTMKTEIAANYPSYTAPPPLDDTRPNETSWTFFKKVLDKKKAVGKGQD